MAAIPVARPHFGIVIFWHHLFQSRKPAASGIGRKARNLKWCSEPFTVNDSKWCAPNLGLGSIFAPRQTGLTLCP